MLRIATSDGRTRKLCGRPLAPRTPTNYTLEEAQATGADWWFTTGKGPGSPVAVSQFVYINPDGSCIADPGETYSADYIGQLPDGGCQSDDHCQEMLGGQAGSWTCYAGVNADGVCEASTQDPVTLRWSGTCLCRARSDSCPNG